MRTDYMNMFLMMSIILSFYPQTHLRHFRLFLFALVHCVCCLTHFLARFASYIDDNKSKQAQRNIEREGKFFGEEF